MRHLLRSLWAPGLFMPTVVAVVGMVAAADMVAGVGTWAGVVRTSAEEAPISAVVAAASITAVVVHGWVALAVIEAAVWPRPGVSEE